MKKKKSLKAVSILMCVILCSCNRTANNITGTETVTNEIQHTLTAETSEEVIYSVTANGTDIEDNVVLCDSSQINDVTTAETDTSVITEAEISDSTARELSAEERIRQLSDNNIRLMDINTRKYSQTYYEAAPDGSYAIYEFDEIDTYSEYIELMYDTYTKDVADIFIYYKYGFDSLDDRLAVYSERNITIINNVHWEDYQFEIISLNDTECVFECTSWQYVDNYVSNEKEYTTHKCTAVKCEDGKWRLNNSFF